MYTDAETHTFRMIGHSLTVSISLAIDKASKYIQINRFLRRAFVTKRVLSHKL